MTEIPQTGLLGADKPVKRTRRTQERAEISRRKLVEAGKLLFSERGFDAVSVRDLETAAGVKRNLLAYHFDDKETLWKVSADAIIGVMRSQYAQRMGVIKGTAGRDTLAFYVRFYVHFHARHPQLSRLMSLEAIHHSWRTQYLIDTYVRPSALKLEKLVHEIKGLDRDAFIHWYYIMISSTATIFSFSAECEELFGVDPCEESRVEAHADILVSMLLESG